MKVSVAMAVYNGELYLKQQLESILNQTILPDEVVIVDDCSKDASLSILRDFEKEYPIIKIIENERNLGYILNFRKALSYTTGEIIFLADQDDIWMPNKIEKILDIYKSNQCSVISSEFILIDDTSNPIKDSGSYRLSGRRDQNIFISDVNEIKTVELIFKNRYPGCTLALSAETRDLYLKINNLEVVHDHAILIIGSIIGGAYYLNEPTMMYRVHGNNNIGIRKKNKKITLALKKPSKPKIIKLLEELNVYTQVHNYRAYKVICYLRLPYIMDIIERLFKG